MRARALAAVVFDLDGTLVDSTADIAAALGEVFRAYGGRALSGVEVAPLLGEGARRLVDRAAAAAGVENADADLDRLTAEYLAAYRRAPVERTRAFAGVDATLSRLTGLGVPIGVCTNKPQELAVQVLAGLGLADCFVAVLGADAVERSKPHPGHLLATIAHLDANPAETLFVGDSRFDEACARDAGVPFVAVPWAEDDVTGERLDSFADLVDRVAPSATRRTTVQEEAS